MLDRRLNLDLGCLLATLAALIATGLVAGTFMGLDERFAHVGVLIVGGGNLLRVRGWLRNLEDRERNAFLLGADSERERLRSVR